MPLLSGGGLCPNDPRLRIAPRLRRHIGFPCQTDLSGDVSHVSLESRHKAGSLAFARH